MRAAFLETVSGSVSVATTRCHSWGVSQMNKFEQVSSNHHQISLAWRVLRSDVWGREGLYLTYPRGGGGYPTMWPIALCI